MELRPIENCDRAVLDLDQLLPAELVLHLADMDRRQSGCIGDMLQPQWKFHRVVEHHATARQTLAQIKEKASNPFVRGAAAKAESQLGALCPRLAPHHRELIEHFHVLEQRRFHLVTPDLAIYDI